MYLPDGRTYTTGRKPVQKAAEDAASAKMRASLVELGGEVMKAALAREKLADELDAAADRWFAKAAQQAAPTGEIKKFYVAKARSARDKAAAVRRGEDVKQ